MLRSVMQGGVIFLGAMLLFLIQPMMGKAMLPRFGGSAGVWTTAMLFFQAGLLAGYAYAHFITRRLPPRIAALLHVLLLATSALLMPMARPSSLPGGDPASRILISLAASIGLPYFLLSSTSPLVQAWSVSKQSG